MIFPSEIQLDYNPTKSQSDLMCDIYPQSSVCLSYQVLMSIYPVIYPCIDLPFTSTLEGDGVKACFIIAQPNFVRNLGLLGILWFTTFLPCGDIDL